MKCICLQSAVVLMIFFQCTVSTVDLTTLIEHAKRANVIRESLPTPLFQNNLKNDMTCFNKLTTLITNLRSSNQAEFLESIYFLDSAGKPASGLLQGNTNFMGGYDECKTMEKTSKKYYKVCKYSGYAQLNKTPLPISWIGCLPRECHHLSKVELKEFVDTLNQYLKIIESNTTVFKFYLDRNTAKLTCEQNVDYDAGAYIGIVVLSIITFLVFIATCYDLFEPLILEVIYGSKQGDLVNLVTVEDTEVATSDGNQIQSVDDSKSGVVEPTAITFLKCFSLYKTLSALTATDVKEGQVLCLNGIRVFSINWVVLGHTYLFIFSATGDYASFPKLINQTSFSIVLNGFPSVDSFFTLSGFLVSFLLLKLLKKGRGCLTIPQWISYYIHRWFRLSIPYLVVILTQAFLYRMWIQSGTFMDSLTVDHESCKSYWWADILYVNNFVPKHSEKQCLGQGWYLANDFQMYIIAPLFVYLLYRYSLFGLISTGGMVGVCVIVSAVLTKVYKLGASTLDPKAQKGFYILYNKPYIRMSPYMIGIIAGWICWKYCQRIKIAMSQISVKQKVCLAAPLWLASLAIQYGVLFGIHDNLAKSMSNIPVKAADNIAYESLYRVAWGLSLCIQILLCQTGLGGPINAILSWKGFIVLGRLTYGVYLIHFGLGQLLLNQLRHLYYLNPTYEIMLLYLGLLGMSYLASIVLYTFVDQPLALLEGLTYRKK